MGAGAENQEEEVQLTKMQSILVAAALFVGGWLVPFLGALELKFQDGFGAAKFMSIVKYIYTFSMSNIGKGEDDNDLRVNPIGRIVTCVWSVFTYSAIAYGLLALVMSLMAEEPKAEEAGDVEAPAV